MKYDLVRHFINELPENVINLVKNLNNTFENIKGKLILKMFLIPNSKITVFGVVSEGTEGKYLYIGVSRCAENDTFSRKQGREYAEWRAKNAPSLKIKMDISATDDEIQDLFLAVSTAMNKKFRGIKNIHLLARLPEELKLKFVPKPVVRQKWNQLEIQKAKDKAYSISVARKMMEEEEKKLKL
jgi:hypothetical protein